MSAAAFIRRHRAVPLAAAIAATIGIGFAVASAHAEGTRVARMKAAFGEWAARSGVANGALAVVENGRVIDGLGVGRVTPSDPEPVASDSKSVTAICVLKLVEAGKLHFEDTLGALLPRYFSEHPPADPDAKAITLSALLTHTSGLGTDPTQGSSLLQFRPFTRPAAQNQLAAALAVPLKQPSYSYNNVNYAALDLVIEKVTGEPYETYCSRTVLRPVGITGASINPEWKVMAAFGGWRLWANDEARFLSYFDPAAGLLKITPQAWPKTSLGGGAFYSLGTLMRQSGAGYNFWHFGSWIWNGHPAASFGAYFARWSNGYGVAANYQPTVSDSAARDLDESMAKAAWQ